ncbi:MAG: TetR/AcrR family transcriptional regulator [Gordonia sp. (in: high G+C Gram-positive bacteria)]
MSYTEHLFSDCCQEGQEITLGETRRQAARGDGDRLRAELVDAAISLLLDPEASGTPSLRAIARACDVAPSAVYMHFPSQAELMYAVTDQLFSRLRDALDASDLPDGSADQRLTAMIDAYLAWADGHPGAYRLLFERPDPPPGAGAGPGLDLLTRVRDTLTGVAPDARDALAMQIWSVLHGVASLRLHKPDAPWRTTGRDDVHAVVDALLGRAP